MKKLCFYNQKGGVGKTTISLLIANLFTKNNKKVCIVENSSGEKSISYIREDILDRFSLSKKKFPDIKTLESYSEYKEKEEEYKDYDIIIFDIDTSMSIEITSDFVINSNYVFLLSNAESAEDYKIDQVFYTKFLNPLSFEEELDIIKTYTIFYKCNTELDLSTLPNLESLDVLEFKIPTMKKYEDLSSVLIMSDIETNTINLFSKIESIIYAEENISVDVDETE